MKIDFKIKMNNLLDGESHYSSDSKSTRTDQGRKDKKYLHFGLYVISLKKLQ